MSAVNKFKTKTIVVCNQKVLLASRDDSDWTPVASEMREEESPDEAARRDVSEITGLDVQLFHPTPDAFSAHIKPETQPVFINIEDETDTKSIDFYYYARSQNEDIHPPQGQPGQYRWFTFEEIENSELSDSVRDLCRGALKTDPIQKK